MLLLDDDDALDDSPDAVEELLAVRLGLQELQRIDSNILRNAGAIG